MVLRRVCDGPLHILQVSRLQFLPRRCGSNAVIIIITIISIVIIIIIIIIIII